MKCPRCEAKLERLEAKDTSFRGCESCGGVWLNRRTWKQVREARSNRVVETAESVAARASREVRPDGAEIQCPDCGIPMTVTRLAFAPVAVDVCQEHGVWFDRHELGQAVAALRQEAARKASRTAAVAGGAVVAGASVGAASLAASPPPAVERAAASGDTGDAIELGADLLEVGVDVADSGLLEGLGSLLEGAGELVGGLLEGLSGL